MTPSIATSLTNTHVQPIVTRQSSSVMNNDKKRSSWGPTEVGMLTESGVHTKRGHRRTPSDGRVPMPSLDNAVKVLVSHKAVSERCKCR